MQMGIEVQVRVLPGILSLLSRHAEYSATVSELAVHYAGYYDVETKRMLLLLRNDTNRPRTSAQIRYLLDISVTDDLAVEKVLGLLAFTHDYDGKIIGDI